VIQENFKVVKLFLNRNIFELADLDYSMSHKGIFYINFKNKGLATLYNPIISFEINNDKFLTDISDVFFENQYQDLKEISNYKIDSEDRILSF